MEANIQARYEQLERRVLEGNPGADQARLRAAFTYADEHHGSQLRKSGEPYITHPVAVAEIVAELGLALDSIIAALPHACSEAPDPTHGDLPHRVGPTVAGPAEGAPRLNRLRGS